MARQYRNLLLILLLTSMWSPSFLFIKLAVTELPPLTTVALRLLLGGLILCSILLFKKQPLPKDPKFWMHSAVMGFFASAFPFYMFCYAEQFIDSALAAILNGTAPMFTAFLAHLFIPSDRLNVQKTLGISLGISGLTLLFLPNLLQASQGELSTAGLTAGAFGALSYAISHVYGKKYLMNLPQFVSPSAQIIASACMLLPLALFVDTPWNLPMPSFWAILGVAGLAVMGTAFAFIFYYKILDECGPTAVSMAACFFPAGGMFLGYLFLGESLNIRCLWAAAMILSGIVVVNQVIQFKFLNKKLKETP